MNKLLRVGVGISLLFAQNGFGASAACPLSSIIASGMMAKYDQDGNASLNREESLLAFPAFEPGIIERLKQGSSKEPAPVMVRGLYTYAIYFGRVPTRQEEAPHFITWVMQEGSNPRAYERTAAEVETGVTAMLCAE